MIEQPPWLAAAWTELGQREVRGSADNARIRAFFREVGHPAILHDEVAWCAAFVGACLERGGLASTRSLMARSYLRWGNGLSAARIGAVAVLSRGSDPAAGHVGFLLGETPTHVVLLGGNQGDAVSVATYSRRRLLGLRWPGVATDANGAAEKDAVGATATAGDATFEEALAHVLEMEGGYTDDPHDPGGPTNKGVTLGVYARWRGVQLTAATRAGLKAELRRIPKDAVREIYLTRYWRPAHCSEMAPALAFFHFDASVNHGVTGAMRLLQRAVGTDADGEIGPNTRAAIARVPIDECLLRYAEVRRARYRALPHFWRFGRGWLRRVDTTLLRARTVVSTRGAEGRSGQQQKGTSSMIEGTGVQGTPQQPQGGAMDQSESTAKWWGQSITIWGAMITALSTVLPTIGPAFGIDITGDLVREAGEGIVQTVQAVGGLIGTLMTIYGRMRASTPLAQRSVQMKL